MEKASNTLELTAIHRIIMLSMIILQFILFAYSVVLLLNYCVFKIPFLQAESLTVVTSNKAHYLKNSCLYLLFWLQHIIMATFKYKIKLHNLFKYFVLYERYLFNVASGLTFWYSFSQAQPEYTQVFTLPFWLCMLLFIYGLFCLSVSMKQLGTGIFMPYKLSQVINSKYISYEIYGSKQQNLKVDGIYSYLRHPMQAGFLSIIIFGNNVYTIDKLLFVLIMGGGILLGIYMQEKRMETQFLNYKEYIQKVKYRFLPF